MLFEAPPPAQTPYRVLARAYRPQAFEDLVGQDLLVKALTQALNQGRLPHAFVLTGIRGVGKTTTARLLARCLNCATGPTIKPCGTCDSCLAIQGDRHLDVVEIDAASHTGVDDVRDLLESGRYRAVTGRYKVYIIDEVHMLSKSAFNALLKTLEEPPPHLIFILATTEIEKVPPTVLSRCMRCELKRVDLETLARHMEKIAAQEQATIDAPAARLVARAAEGSVRDAMSLLDQAITLSNRVVTEAVVQDMLGLIDKARIVDLFETLTHGHLKDALSLAKDFHTNGANSLKIAEDLLEVIHTLTMIKMGKTIESDLPPYAATDGARLKSLAGQLSTELLLKAWNHLLLGVTEIQVAPMPALALDMILVRLAHADDNTSQKERQAEKEGQGRPGIEEGARLAPLSAPKPAVESVLKAPPSIRPEQSMVVPPRPTSEPEATLEHSDSLGKKSISTLEDVVDILRQNKEVLLAESVCRDVRFVSVSPGALVVNCLPGTASDLLRRVGQALTAFTQETWIVTHASQPGEATLAEKAAALRQQDKESVLQDSLVQAAVDAFPGAVLNVELSSPPTK